MKIIWNGTAHRFIREIGWQTRFYDKENGSELGTYKQRRYYGIQIGPFLFLISVWKWLENKE